MTHNETTDLRIRRTRHALREALIELSCERGFASLNVQDIAERAMVNRATFYRHYQDKYDLLMATIKEVVEDLGLRDKPLPFLDHVETLEQGAPDLIQLFEHIATHRRFYSATFSKETFPLFEAQLRGLVEQILLGHLHNANFNFEYARLPLDLCMHAMGSMVLGVIRWWLDEGMPYTPLQMARWLPQMNMLGMRYCLGFDRITPPNISPDAPASAQG